MAAGGVEEIQTFMCVCVFAYMCVCVCGFLVGGSCANESFNVTLWLKVYHFSSQDNSLVDVFMCVSLFPVRKPAVTINL